MISTKTETAVTFSWLATLKFIGIAITLALLGLLMFQADVTLIWVLGVIAMLAGVGLLIALPFMGGMSTAPCPVCSATIEVMGKDGRYIECAKCLEYLEASGGKLRQMDENYVADEPVFKVRLPWWDDLRAPTGATITIGGPQDYVNDRLQKLILTKRIPDRTVSAVWPGQCCVCGSTPTRYETLAQEVNAGPGGAIAGVRDQELVVKVERIPHCGQHEKGVKLSESPGEIGRVLFFRSYGYRNAFRRANPGKITWE